MLSAGHCHLTLGSGSMALPEIISAITSLLQPMSQSASKRLFERKSRHNDAADLLVGSLVRKLTSVIDEADVDDLVHQLSKRDKHISLRKYLNFENSMQLVIDLVKEKENFIKRPIDEDWFFQWFSSVENISDERIQQIWARAFANKIDSSKNSVSCRALDTLRLMQYQDVLNFARLNDVINHLGYVLCNGNNVVNAVFGGRDVLDDLIDLNLAIRSQNMFSSVPVPPFLSIGWELRKGFMQPDPFTIVTMSARAKELAQTLPKEIDAHIDHESAIDFSDDLFRAKYINLLASNFGKEHSVFLSIFPDRIFNQTNVNTERMRRKIRSHYWSHDEEKWIREIKDVPLEENLLKALEGN